MADTWNHKTIISPDESLYIDGNLFIKGNIVQVETTQIINKLESNTLIINSDGSSYIDPTDNVTKYAIPQLVLKYNYTGQQALGWGMMHYRADDTSNGTDAGLGYMRFQTVGYPVNGAIQIQKIHTMPEGDSNSSSNIAILEGNSWSGNACAAYAMTSPVTFSVTSDDNSGYTDIVPVSDTFTKAGDTVTLDLNLAPTGVTANIYGADTGTTNRIDVDAKGRITNVVNQPIEIIFDQVTGGNITANVANVVYDIFSAGMGLTYTGSAGTPQGQFYITDTTVDGGNYGSENSTVNFTVNSQGQLTTAANVIINIQSSQVTDFDSAVEGLFNAQTVYDGTGWTGANLAYTPGLFTYTPPTQQEVRNTINAVGDINYDNTTGEISLNDEINQDLTFRGLVDLSGATVPGFTIQGNVDIEGNLNVVAKEDLYVKDANIVMNVGNAIQDSHLVIDRSGGVGLTNSFIRWNHVNEEWSHNDGTNEWVLVRTTDDIAEGTSNLWYTQDRVNSLIDAYVVAGDGIEFQSVIGPGNPNAFGIFADLGDYLTFDISKQITISSNVVTTDLDFDMNGTYTFVTGNLILPDGAEDLDGYIYTELGSNEAFVHMNGVNIPITPTIDFGRVDNGDGVLASGAIEIYAGTAINPIGPANANIAIIRGLKAGSNTSIYYDPDPTSEGNVIIIDAEGLSQSEVRDSFSVANISGFGNINYSNTTGVISYAGVSTTDIRNQFSGTGLIGYDPLTGVISTTADNFANWSFVTDDGPGEEQNVISQERVTIQGGTGISVTNAGNVITVVNTNTSADITAVIAGAGLTGGGASGDVTLDVGAGTGVSVAADSISIGQDVATTADVDFSSVTADIVTTNITTGGTGTAGTFTGQWDLTAGSTLTATYADLAEKYKADKAYEPGTVVVVGGETEVTACHSFMSMRVAGVISANPAFVMNEGLTEGVMVALKGRVPVRVSGQVKKGDLLVTADELGCATSAQTDDVPPTAVVGIALKDSEMGWTEVKV